MTEQATLPATIANHSMFFDIARFEHAQRVARVFATSTMIPEHFKNNIGNCLIAMNYADRVMADVFMVMQSMYVVHGRPGIEAKLAIALFNSSGKFTPLRFRFNKERTECVAYAKEIRSGETCEGVAASIQMAKDEGWHGKNGSKWKTMPELMLMYRSASFFIKQYAPEVLLGMQTKEEVEDIIDITPEANAQAEIENKANKEMIDLVTEKQEAAQVEPQTEQAPSMATAPGTAEVSKPELTRHEQTKPKTIDRGF